MSNNGHIRTYTGRVINPLDPDPNEICIEDIAHSLSQQCRFTGHTKEFYSTGQHSVLVARVFPGEAEDMLCRLLHDAPETYMSDLASPLKKTDWGQHYREAEQKLEEAVAKAFGLLYPFPETVKKADLILLNTEIRDLMPADMTGVEVDKYPPAKFKIVGWSPETAKGIFLSDYKWLTK